MAEYIEREALQSALQRKKSGVADKRYTEGWNDCLLRVKSMVHGAKAADVSPVVHGRWLWDSGAERYFCSNCDVQPSGLCNGCTEHLSNYCPNCGARMDGE